MDKGADGRAEQRAWIEVPDGVEIPWAAGPRHMFVPLITIARVGDRAVCGTAGPVWFLEGRIRDPGQDFSQCDAFSLS